MLYVLKTGNEAQDETDFDWWRETEPDPCRAPVRGRGDRNDYRALFPTHPRLRCDASPG